MQLYDKAQEAYAAHKLSITNLLGIPDGGYTSLNVAEQIAVNNRLVILTKQFYEAVGCSKFLLFDFAILHDANLVLKSKPSPDLSQALDKYITQQIKYLSGYCALQTTNGDDFLQWAQDAAVGDSCPTSKILCTSFLEGNYEDNNLEDELNSILILQGANNAKDVFASGIGIANGLRLAALHDTCDADVSMQALLHDVCESAVLSIPGHEEFVQQIDASAVAEIFQSSVARESFRQTKSQAWDETQKLEIEKLIRQTKREAIKKRNLGADQARQAQNLTEQQKFVDIYNTNITNTNNLIKEQGAIIQSANQAAAEAAQLQYNAAVLGAQAAAFRLAGENVERNFFANFSNKFTGGGATQHSIGFSASAGVRGLTVATNHSIQKNGMVIASASSAYNSIESHRQRIEDTLNQVDARRNRMAQQQLISVRNIEKLQQLQQVLTENSAYLQGYQLPDLQLNNPYIDRSNSIFKGFKSGINTASNYAHGAIDATLLVNRPSMLTSIMNEKISFKPEINGSIFQKTTGSLQQSNNKSGFQEKLVSVVSDAALTILTLSSKSDASPLIFSAPLNSAVTSPAVAVINNTKQHDKKVKFKPLAQELREIGEKTAQVISFFIGMTPNIMLGILITPPHLRGKEDIILPGSSGSVINADLPPSKIHEQSKESLNTGHSSNVPKPGATTVPPYTVHDGSQMLLMFKDSQGRNNYIKCNYVFRGTSTKPESVFENGFRRDGALSLQLHIETNDGSGFISTTKSPNIARSEEFVSAGDYVYTVKRQEHGIDVNEVLGKASKYPHELEIAVPHHISPNDIMGARRVNEKNEFVGEFIKNHNYRP